nr:uncharacterized protein LOC111770228 [Equus caballus]
MLRVFAAPCPRGYTSRRVGALPARRLDPERAPLGPCAGGSRRPAGRGSVAVPRLRTPSRAVPGPLSRPGRRLPLCTWPGRLRRECGCDAVLRDPHAALLAEGCRPRPRRRREPPRRVIAVSRWPSSDFGRGGSGPGASGVRASSQRPPARGQEWDARGVLSGSQGWTSLSWRSTCSRLSCALQGDASAEAAAPWSVWSGVLVSPDLGWESCCGGHGLREPAGGC